MSEREPDRCEFFARDLIVKLDLSIMATVASIDPAVEAVLKIVAGMSCGRGKEFEIETALREALANAVIHGAKEDPTKTVRISVGCDEKRGMIVVVRDPGEGFDPKSLPSPLQGERIYSEHGRGIFLINCLMDEVRFRKGGTEIWMRKG